MVGRRLFNQGPSYLFHPGRHTDELRALRPESSGRAHVLAGMWNIAARLGLLILMLVAIAMPFAAMLGWL